MTITIRLPHELESALRRQLRIQGIGVSQFVRTAIAEKLERSDAQRHSPYELGKDLFGKYGDGDRSGSVQRKRRVREAVDAKHHRR